MKKAGGLLSKFRLTRRRVIFLLIVLAIGGGVYWWRGSRKRNGYDEAAVERGEVAERLVLSGEIKAVEQAELSFETSGRLVYVGVKEGDQVKKGMLLGKLDTTTLNSAYQQALANLRKYDATVDNVHDQVKDHSSDETYAQRDTRTTAEATKDSAYEAVIAAERALKGASLYAPFDGVVTNVANPFSGVFVLYTVKQFELVNPETLYFEVAADQTEVVQLNEGQEVEMVLDAYEDRVLTGVISEISYAPDAAEVGVVYQVRVDFTEGGVEYRLGMTGDASFVVDRAEDVLYVPSGFVESDKDGKYVLVDKGKKKVYVEVGVEGEEYTEIRGEIGEGEAVYD